MKRLALLPASLLALLGPAAAATTTRRPQAAGTTAADAGCDKAQLTLVTPGKLTVGTDNPAFPPWFDGGTPKGSDWEFNDPNDRQGLRERGRLRGRREARLREGRREVDRRPVQQLVQAGPEELRLRHQPDLGHGPARPGGRLQRLVLRREPGARRAERDADRRREVARRPQVRTSSARRSARRASATSRTRSSRTRTRACTTPRTTSSPRSTRSRSTALVVDLPTAFFLVGAEEVKNGKVVGQFPLDRRARSTSGCSSRRATRCATA